MYDSCISLGLFFGRKRSTYTRVNTVHPYLQCEHSAALVAIKDGPSAKVNGLPFMQAAQQ